MRKQDQLLLLIKSLTTAEKKYFVQTAKADGQIKSYLQLYEALLKADSYNADELSRQLKKKKTDLANEKKYLEYLLLKSLRAFNEKHYEVNLYNALSSVIILKEKHLYTQALAIIEKAKPAAWLVSNFSLYAELCFQQAGLIELMRGNTTSQGRARIIAAKNDGLNAIMLTKAFCELENIQTEATGLMERFNFLNEADVLSQVNKMLQHPALKQQYKSFRLLLTKNETLGLLYRLKKDFKKCGLYLEENLTLNEKYPVETELTEHHYFWQLNNLFQTYVQLKDYHKAQLQIDYLATKKYHRLGLKNNELDKRFEPALIERKLSLCLYQYIDKQADKQDLLKALGGFERDAARTMSVLTENEQMVIFASAAKLYLITGQPDKALNFTMRVVNNADQEFRPPLQANARLTAILAHYELGNLRILKSLVLSARRFSKKNKLHNEAEVITYQHILLLASPKSRREQVKTFTNLLKALRSLPKTVLERNMLQADWAERKLEQLKQG